MAYNHIFWAAAAPVAALIAALGPRSGEWYDGARPAVPPSPSELAVRLAEARQAIVTRTGMPGRSDLEQVDREVASHAAQAFLDAAATAGIVFAAVDARDLRAPRTTANVRDLASRPLDRDDYATALADRTELPGPSRPLSVS